MAMTHVLILSGNRVTQSASLHMLHIWGKRAKEFGKLKELLCSRLWYRIIGSLVEYLLITRRWDPNKGHDNQSSPLCAEIIPEHVEITQLLLEYTADLDLNARETNAMALTS